MSEKELTDLIERIKERRLKLEMSYQDLSDASPKWYCHLLWNILITMFNIIII